jgi:transcriptional regulator with XRE-family HTH domain
VELNERIAFVRKAAGLSQEQLGQQLGVTRQAVSKWESGQSVPDAAMAAKLCQTLHVSADFVLLGLEPEEAAQEPESAAFPRDPWICPCCRQSVPAGVLSCPDCGFNPSAAPEDDGKRYALLTVWTSFMLQPIVDSLGANCGISEEEAKERVYNRGKCIIRRGLTQAEVTWMASHLPRELFTLRIVADDDPNIAEESLQEQEEVIPLPEYHAAEIQKRPAADNGLGFGGTVAAVVVGIILAIVVLSFL